MENKRFSCCRKWLSVCAILCIVLSGCRTKKELVEDPASELTSEADFFRALCEQSLDYRTLSAKMQIEIVTSSGKELGSRAQLKMRRDDRLQISVQPLLGIEMFRLEVSRDSIKALDRMNKRYFAEAVTALKEQRLFDFNLANLQALLTNRLFLPGEATLSSTDRNRFDGERVATGYRLRTIDSAGIEYRFTTDRQAKLCTTEIADGSRYSLTWDYTNFHTVDGRLFPMNMLALLRENKLFIHFNGVEVDTPVEMSFHIPPTYEQVLPEQILKMLKP